MSLKRKFLFKFLLEAEKIYISERVLYYYTEYFEFYPQISRKTQRLEDISRVY